MERSDAFAPIASLLEMARSILPARFGFPKLTFIMVHYLYMIGLTIVGSVILFPGGIAYIDALFFAAGSATQSGLNTLNLNDLYTYQQVTMMLMACISNPVFINSMVVFVRLSWFEKRFEHIVKDIREQRRSRARTFSRSKSDMREDLDAELGNVRPAFSAVGKAIKVLHHTTRPNGMTGSTAKTREEEKVFAEKMLADSNTNSVEPTPEGSNKASSQSDQVVSGDEAHKTGEQPPQETYMGLNPKIRREITFADEVSSNHAEQNAEISRAAELPDMARHIEFLERQQRLAKQEGGTLHIPGPRDFDRGEVPKALDDSEDEEMDRSRTNNTSNSQHTELERARKYSDGRSEELNEDDHAPRRAITINAPDHPDHRNEKDPDDDENGTSILQKLKSGLSHRRTQSGNKPMQRRGSLAKTVTDLTSSKSLEPMPYLTWQATVGRNSAFFGLTEAQREELGGIEYRSLKTLAGLLIFYFVGFHILGMMVLLPWIIYTQPWNSVVAEDGQSPAWWGVFTPASMFNDLGFTLTPDSMVSFQNAVLPLLFGSFLIIIGNTGFPCMLRFVIWVTSKFVPHGSPLWEELHFLLDHPRRCFTLLFPSKATWWLFWVLLVLNCIDLLFFIILDLNDDTVTSLAPGFRVLNGWFQAASTRTAGFASVNLAALHPAIQVSYMIMMYISVFPIAISVRRTNVYEEKSLGLWGGEDEEDDQNTSYVGQHLRRQLSFDLWYIFLGFFIICIVEGDRIANTNEYAFTMFSVLFEIVSAYGTVGLSLGYPGIDESFSAEFRTISKLVIIAMMIRGRHRGLPYALDRAILLPSENLNKKEAEESERRLARRGSMHNAGRERSLSRGRTWDDRSLDEEGLPRLHTAADSAMTAAAGGVQDHEGMRRAGRRASTMSTASEDVRRRRRSRGGLAKVIAGGLSAGPTVSKYD